MISVWAFGADALNWTELTEKTCSASSGLNQKILAMKGKKCDAGQRLVNFCSRSMGNVRDLELILTYRETNSQCPEIGRSSGELLRPRRLNIVPTSRYDAQRPEGRPIRRPNTDGTAKER